MSLHSADYPDTRRDLHWIKSSGDERGGQPLLATLRAGAWFIVVTTVLSLVGLSFYLARATDVYESSADLLVTQAVGDNAGIPEVTLLRASTDPVRNVETVARLVTAPDVIRRATANAKLDRSPASVRRSIQASPVAESDIVTITASDPTPDGARRLANAVATAAVDLRTEALHNQLDDVIARMRQRAKEAADPATKEQLTSRVADLETFREMPDPTIRVATAAELPTSPIAPRRTLSFIIALMAGVLVGVGCVIAFQLLDPRIVSVDQLRERYILPILATPRRRRFGLLPSRAPIVPDDFRTLRSVLLGDEDRPRAVSGLLLARSEADAKWSTIGLARSLAVGGDDVLIARFDDRATDVELDQETSTRKRKVGLRERAVQLPGEPPNMLVLREGVAGMSLDGPAAARLITEAEASADWFLVAVPSYERSADALPLGRRADYVLLVVRLASTRVADLQRLAESLSDQGIEPMGFVVLPR